MYEQKIIENLRDFTAKYQYEDQKLSETCLRAADAIEELQSQLPKWIPVSERLPDDYAEVNIAWKNTAPPPYYEFVKDKVATGSAVYCKGRWYWYSAVCADCLKEYGSSPMDTMDDAIRVIAWMPLPEPPKEETDG